MRLSFLPIGSPILRRENHFMNIHETEAKIINLNGVVKTSQKCPYCKEMMRGPFNKYKMRQKDLYFDLDKKFLHCDYCRIDVDVVDFNVLLERLSNMLPPADARNFSMKNNLLYERMPERLRHLFFSIQEEYDHNITLPVDNLSCIESGFCSDNGETYECIHCINKL
jgi:hypothetical protein